MQKGTKKGSTANSLSQTNNSLNPKVNDSNMVRAGNVKHHNKLGISFLFVLHVHNGTSANGPWIGCGPLLQVANRVSRTQVSEIERVESILSVTVTW